MMELTSPSAIQQVKEIHPHEVEPLFWVMEDAIYANQLAVAHGVFNIFLYIGKHNASLLTNLKRCHLDRLKKITFELHDQDSYKAVKSIDVKFARDPKPMPFHKESELRDYLSAHTGVLSDAFGQRVELVGVEVETDCEYRCDIVVKNDDYLFPIELKIYGADHRVVSQCNKYCFYFYRQARYDRFRKIQGVVIANGFDSWSINELRREGHWIFDIIPKNSTDIELRRIENACDARG